MRLTVARARARQYRLAAAGDSSWWSRADASRAFELVEEISRTLAYDGPRPGGA